jgi:hypothetical protein
LPDLEGARGHADHDDRQAALVVRESPGERDAEHAGEPPSRLRATLRS